MNLAGYLVHTPKGTIGERGTAYTYILAGNGLFLEAANPLLEARALIAPARVRGLEPLEPYLELRHGRIPGILMDMAVGACAARPDRETYVAIAWDGREYRVILPPQDGGAGHVSYEPVPGTVVGIHSHGRLGAFFSEEDDRDDQGFLISVVLGELGHLVPQARARLSIYGYFAPVKLNEVFTGVLLVLEEGDG